MTKRQIDIFRESGGSFSIANPEDGTAIKEMFTYADFLLIVTERCTYKIQMADQIDPKRENPNLPKVTQQKLFDYGTNSEIVGRTLLTAKVMLRKEFLPSSIDLERGMKLSFEALREIVAMNTAAIEFHELETQAVSGAEQSRRKDGSLVLPAIGHVETRCKTFAQKADHAGTKLYEITKLFFATEDRGTGWSDFENFVGKKYGEDDNFSKVMKIITPFLLLVRNMRDCLEHGNIRNGVTMNDFSLRSDGIIVPPSIAIDFRGTVQPPVSISHFMNETAKMFLDTFEILLTHLCAKHVQAFAGMPVYIELNPEDRRQNKHVRFAYGMDYQDHGFMPIG